MYLKNLKKNFSFTNFSLILTIFLFFFLRFYNLPKRLGFDWDQETLSFQLWGIIRNHDLILIGHRATDAMGFYFGPYFEYLVVPFYYLSNLHPWGLIPFLLVVNVFFFSIAFLIFLRIFNKNISIGFLFLWAINPLCILYDITVWTPLLVFPGYVLVIYMLWKIYENPSFKQFLLLGLIVGFFTQMHSLFFFIDIFAGCFLLITMYKKKITMIDSIKKLILLISTFSVFLTPLLLFDIKHNFLNTKLFIGYFTRRVQGQPEWWESLEVFSNFFKPFTIITSSFIGIFLLLGFLFLFLYLSKKRTGFFKIFYISSTILLIFTVIIYSRFTERPSEYYFYYLYPLISIACLDVIYKIKRSALIVVLMFFFLVNIREYKKLIQTNQLGLNSKEKVVLTLKNEIENRPFNLTYNMPAGLNVGYEYLIKYHKLNVQNNSNFPLVILTYPAKKGELHINKIGIKIPQELKKVE